MLGNKRKRARAEIKRFPIGVGKKKVRNVVGTVRQAEGTGRECDI